jgi:hypothetical protein
MKIGFIVECGPKGAETQVIPYLAKMIREDIEAVVVPLERKPILKKDCGEFTKKLLESSCRMVMIVWDLLPSWGEYEGRGCRHDDRREIFSSLKEAGLKPNDKRIRLVCIEKMIEAWLLADEKALSNFLSTKAHAVKVSKYRNPETVKDPKAALKTLFGNSKSPIVDYLDRIHALRIVQKADISKLRHCSSFRRFEEKIKEVFSAD